MIQLMKYLLILAAVQCLQFCTSGKELCFTTTLTADQKSMQFVITKSVAGWVGIGFGSSMPNTEMIVVQDNGGQLSAQTRFATDFATPDLIKNDYLVTLSNGPNTITFTRPLAPQSSGNNFSPKVLSQGAMSMIFAYSTQSGFKQHTNQGGMTVDLFSSDSIVGGGIDKGSIVVIHGLCMAFAWVILAPLGILAAQSLKGKLKEKWFWYHKGAMILVVGFALVGYILAFLMTSVHFNDAHKILGLLLLFMVTGQFFLGQYINKKFDPDRTFIPLRDRFHWWAGRIILLLALLNALLGVMKLGLTWLTIFYCVIAGAVLLALMSAYFVMPRIHHTSMTSGEFSRSGSEIPLNNRHQQ